MPGEDLERRLGVGVVRRLEAQVLDAHLGEEDVEEACAAQQGGESARGRSLRAQGEQDAPMRSARVRLRSAMTPSTW